MKTFRFILIFGLCLVTFFIAYMIIVPRVLIEIPYISPPPKEMHFIYSAGRRGYNITTDENYYMGKIIVNNDYTNFTFYPVQTDNPRALKEIMYYKKWFDEKKENGLLTEQEKFLKSLPLWKEKNITRYQYSLDVKFYDELGKILILIDENVGRKYFNEHQSLSKGRELGEAILPKVGSYVRFRESTIIGNRYFMDVDVHTRNYRYPPNATEYIPSPEQPELAH